MMMMRTTLIIWLCLLEPLCLVNFTITINAATSHCLGHQHSLLLHLKNSLVYNQTQSKKLIHWNHVHDCCHWNGVSCYKGHVVDLDLSQESIVGGNFSSLFHMQYLQSLNLAYNEFHFEIYSEFKNLKNLRYLNLSNAGFMGQIPTEISYLIKLETLDLSTTITSSSKHGLKLEKPNMVEFVQNFTRMKELYLDGVAISAKGEEWCHAVSSLQSLQVLSMSSCNLSGPLDSSLTKLQSLSILQLDHNNLASPIPEYLGNLSNLTTLQLRSCGLSGVFPKNIFQISSLHVLDVSDNQGLHGSLSNFLHQRSLHYLNLSRTNFSGPLPQTINKLRQLSTLDLSNCQFNETISNSLSDLAELVYLDLSFNNLTGPLPSFNRSKALRILYLNHNYLKGTLSPTHFEGLIDLVSINLEVNSLDGRLPSSLFTLPSLQLLFLANNRFDGQLEEFPNGSSSSLEMLDLSENNFQGRVPLSIFQLKSLSLLQLSTNKFNGTIQLSVVQRLQNLATLDLSNNNLLIVDDNDLPFPKLINLWLASCKLTVFPAFLINQSSLLFLDLSNNQIEGTIPNWIWRLEILCFLNLSNNFLTDMEGPFQNLSSILFYLDLHGNQLQGPAPIFTKNIVHLDYSNNRFSSITPSDIGNSIPDSVDIFFSNNNFYGKIDESICNISTLRMLDLSYNGFIGNIPECLTTRKSSSLKLLNLAGNKLNGHISDTLFSTSCSLRFIDLNGNLLNGGLPKSLANCQNLQVLNVGNNQLMDEFPCFLKNISSLSVMVLRSNKFYGQIGCSNVIGDWEKLQIVDVADNKFSGMLPTTLFQTWKELMSDDEDKDKSRFGHLSFNFYDININYSVNLDAITTIFSKSSKMKLAKLVTVEPLYVLDHLFSHVYAEAYSLRRYEDSVTIVIKGQQMKLEKILIAFTSLDFSSNQFEGPIPEEIMSFKALHALNLSHNAFSGHIPSTLGNLRNLESLDLSMNSLRGEIPTELASLSFLAIMNLSYNHLVGRIPTGTQIQSFGAHSFVGNEALCGPPLTQGCGGEEQGLLRPSSKTTNSHSSSSVNWSLLSVELGFTFGFGIFMMPLILWKKWRLWYSKKVDEALYKIVPQLDFVYERRGGKRYRSLRWKPY
ncbi:hypothetical protein AAHE18_12G156600 [Arachis hypogaea]